MIIKICLLTSMLIMTLSCCGQLPDNRQWEEVDLTPPTILSVHPSDSNTLVALFNETPRELASPLIIPDLQMSSYEINGSEITIPCNLSMSPGQEYSLTGTVIDERGNTMTFHYPFYGYNDNPPGVIINEVTTQGSTTHPDMVELKVLSGGDLAGLNFTEGTTDTFEAQLVFPSLTVNPGDYVIIHCKPEGLIEEVDETEDKELSGGIDTHPGAWDFWLPDGDGLGGNNGVIALYAFPGGPIIDGFLYSNRTSTSDENYRGFGTLKVMKMADQLADQQGWKVSGELIAPEDGVNPDPSTATRSICRSSEGTDTNQNEDWHTVPTSTASFGELNSDEVYIP